MELSSLVPMMRQKAIDLPSAEKAGSESPTQKRPDVGGGFSLVHPPSGMQCVTLRVSPVLTSTTMIRLPWQCERNRFGYRRHRRSKATLVPSGEKAGEPSIQPSGGWVIWRMWLPLGYIVEMASRRKKTIRPSVEAVSPLVLFLCSWSAPPLAEFPPPQAANNSREQSPMRRPITSTTRRDGLPLSEWYMPLLLSSLISVASELLRLLWGNPLGRPPQLKT